MTVYMYLDVYLEVSVRVFSYVQKKKEKKQIYYYLMINLFFIYLYYYLRYSTNRIQIQQIYSIYNWSSFLDCSYSHFYYRSIQSIEY